MRSRVAPFSMVIVKRESALHSLHRISQSPCNGKIHSRNCNPRAVSHERSQEALGTHLPIFFDDCRDTRLVNNPWLIRVSV